MATRGAGRSHDKKEHTSRVSFVLDSILCLLYETKESRFEFDLKYPEYGFGKLADLYEGINDIVDDYGLADVADSFEQVADKFGCLHEILFHDNQLGISTSVYRQFNEKQRIAIFEFGSVHWDECRLFIRQSNSAKAGPPGTRLTRLLELLQGFTSQLHDLTREYLLNSPAFYDAKVLERTRISKEKDDNPDDTDDDDEAPDERAAQLGSVKTEAEKTVWQELRFDLDAQLRLTNLNNRAKLFTSRGTHNLPIAAERTAGEENCPNCHATLHGLPEDGIGGECDSEDDEEGDEDDESFISFPGKLAGCPVSPIIDTGGGVNLIQKKWLEENGIIYTRGELPQVALWNADGSVSKRMDKIKLHWIYDPRPDKVWEDVEFIITEDGAQALLGLPFLRKTKIIHSSAGRIVFPEFKKIPRPRGPDGSIPIYHTGTKGGKK